MAGITPTYGLRYPELVDPPDGAALGKNLADDVEAELVRVDGVAADHETRLGTVEAERHRAGSAVVAVVGGTTTLHSVVFSTPFAAPPVVVAVSDNSIVNEVYCALATTTGADIYIGATSSGNCTLQWIAVPAS